MKKSISSLLPPTSSNPAFWVDASPRPRSARSGPEERKPGFVRAFAADIGCSRERLSRLAAIRHYVIYDEPNAAAD